MGKTNKTRRALWEEDQLAARAIARTSHTLRADTAVVYQTQRSESMTQETRRHLSMSSLCVFIWFPWKRNNWDLRLLKLPDNVPTDFSSTMEEKMRSTWESVSILFISSESTRC